MLWEIDFGHLPRYVVIATKGAASVRDFDTMLAELVNSSSWAVGTNQIIDHSCLDYTNFSSKEMESLIAVLKKHELQVGKGCCAIVVKDSLGFGLARMYDLLGGEQLHALTEVFYTMQEAVDWLDTKTACRQKDGPAPSND